MKPAIVLALVIAAFFVALALFAGEPPRIVGTWEGKAELGNGSIDGMTMVISQQGEGFSGTCRDELGVTPEGTALEEITLDSGALTFHLTTSDGDLINLFLTVDGDRMTGHWEDPASGTSGSIELTRKQ